MLTSHDLEQITQILRSTVLALDQKDFEQIRTLIREAAGDVKSDEQRRVNLCSGNIPAALYDLDRRLSDLGRQQSDLDRRLRRLEGENSTWK